uniref:Protein FAM221A n=2 Tax=Mesocestoides corti TaxID=53468 RepID=A0A5K3EJL1_MESCO
MMDNTIKVDSNQAEAIDEYMLYHRIVGDDDNGRTFTPAEYEAYKKRVIPMRLKNRIYMSWVNPNGVDCVLTGPETQCFCTHRYRQHKTDFAAIPVERPIPQPCSKCKCKCYHLMPKAVGGICRCHCKHEATEHKVVPPFLCTRQNCKCTGFKTSVTCDCGFPAYKHTDVSETAEERQARGHPIGHPCVFQAMGGLTGFSSLLPGMARMDASGGPLANALSPSELDAPITERDHPFLRAHKAMIEAFEREFNSDKKETENKSG